MLIRVSSRAGDRWVLPKGTVEKGEKPEEAALREVLEETGLTAETIEPLRTIDYWFVSREEDTRYHKFVYFFLMRATGGDVSRHDHEVEEARWFRFQDAERLCAFENERAVIRQAAERMAGR